MSLCTVDLLTLNLVAAARTVVRFSMMYWASRTARSSMFPFTRNTPCVFPVKGI